MQQKMQKVKGFIKFIIRPVPLFTLGMFPIIIKGTSLINALLLGLAFVISAFVVSVVNTFASKFFSRQLMPAVCVLAGAAAVCLVGFIFTKLSLFDMYTLGAVLPLTAADPLIVTGLVRQNEKGSISGAFINAAVFSAAFFAVVLIVSAVREFLYTGAIFGLTVLDESHRISSAIMPFFGIIMLGLAAAFFAWISEKMRRRRDAERNIGYDN